MVWQRSQVHVHTSAFFGDYGGGNGGYRFKAAAPFMGRELLDVFQKFKS